MKEHSLCGGALESDVNGVPGRSIFTAAYVDFTLRQEFGNTWRCFFSPNAFESGLEGVFLGSRELLKEDFPLCDLWILIREGQKMNLPNTVSLAADRMVAALKPGDKVVIRSPGHFRSHFVTVWEIDREKHQVTFLDPFPEFWSHVGENIDFESSIYLQREFTSISIANLKKMVTAILTVRDK